MFICGFKKSGKSLLVKLLDGNTKDKVEIIDFKDIESVDGKVIYVIRDPRDLYIKLGVDLKKFILSYLIELKLVFDYQGLLGSKNCLIVRFEDLVLNTEEVSKEICKFLGLDSTAFVTDITLEGKPIITEKDNEFRPEKIRTEEVEELPDTDENNNKVIEYAFRDIMEFCSYEQKHDLDSCIDAVKGVFYENN